MTSASKSAMPYNFLCEDMKVKVALKFRGREMAAHGNWL